LPRAAIFKTQVGPAYTFRVGPAYTFRVGPAYGSPAISVMGRL
jgi:hypothetical protein